jgi:hypothetical protein
MTNILLMKQINNYLIYIIYLVCAKITNITHDDYNYIMDYLIKIITPLHIVQYYKNSDKNDFILIDFNEKRVQTILKKCLEIESTSRYPIDSFILYRGADNISYLPVEYYLDKKTDQQHVQYSSISFNNSLLNGIMYDIGACTLRYYKQDNIKQYIILNRFTHSSKILKELFYIPPFHAHSLLTLAGEYFHARTLIPNDANENRQKLLMDIMGLILDDPYNDIVVDYLISKFTRDEFNEHYKQVVSDSNKYELVDKSFKKYLKYKIKYLQLKNSITFRTHVD